jgi:hypothetical protein
LALCRDHSWFPWGCIAPVLMGEAKCACCAYRQSVLRLQHPWGIFTDLLFCRALPKSEIWIADGAVQGTRKNRWSVDTSAPLFAYCYKTRLLILLFLLI